MLDVCAPGWEWHPALHSRRILANGRTYPTLPKYNDIEAGHIRKMARHLGILECAKNQIEGL
jgi:hypothetical protein